MDGFDLMEHATDGWPWAHWTIITTAIAKENVTSTELFWQDLRSDGCLV